jgi:hypothetical protein
MVRTKDSNGKVRKGKNSEIILDRVMRGSAVLKKRNSFWIYYRVIQ